MLVDPYNFSDSSPKGSLALAYMSTVSDRGPIELSTHDSSGGKQPYPRLIQAEILQLEGDIASPGIAANGIPDHALPMYSLDTDLSPGHCHHQYVHAGDIGLSTLSSRN